MLCGFFRLHGRECGQGGKGRHGLLVSPRCCTIRIRAMLRALETRRYLPLPGQWPLQPLLVQRAHPVFQVKLDMPREMCCTHVGLCNSCKCDDTEGRQASFARLPLCRPHVEERGGDERKLRGTPRMMCGVWTRWATSFDPTPEMGP